MNRPRILFLEDSRLYVAMHTQMLEGLAVAIDVAGTVDEAYRLCERWDYAVILLDRVLPDGDGITFAETIRGPGQRNSGTPIIFISGTLTAEQDQFDGYDRGAVDYLVKPVKSLVLVAKVRALLELDRQKIQLKEMVAQLESLNAKLELVAKASAHDIRQPVATLHSSAALLYGINKDSLDARSKSLVTMILRTSERAVETVDSVMTLAELGHKSLVFGEYRFGEILDDVWSDIAEKVRRNHATIEQRGDAKVRVDLALFRRVVQNLVSNAIKFRDEAPPEILVEIGPSEDPGAVQITFSDNGKGFPPSMAETIFRPFERGESGKAGAGLGLALCREIIAVHHGTIWAESSRGEGSHFHISIPGVVE